MYKTDSAILEFKLQKRGTVSSMTMRCTLWQRFTKERCEQKGPCTAKTLGLYTTLHYVVGEIYTNTFYQILLPIIDTHTDVKPLQ